MANILHTHFLILIVALFLSCNFGDNTNSGVDLFPGIEKSEGVYYKYETKSPFTGSTKSTYKNGNPYVVATFVEGKLNGIYTAYYANGQKMGLTHYKRGVKHGKAIAWHENGNIASKVNFEDGKKQGRLEIYYPNGQLNTRTFYSKGEKDSTYTQWEVTGDLYYRASYDMGELIDEKYFKNQ